MDRKLTFFLGLLLHVSSLFGQSSQMDTVTILMKKEIGPKTNLIQPGQLIKDQNKKSLYKAVGDSFDYSGIFEYHFQPDQAIYQSYKAGRLPESDFLRLVKAYNINQSELFNGAIRQQVSVFSGIKNNIKTIICDVNQNNDFSDEVVYQYDMRSLTKFTKADSVPTLKIFYEYYFDKQVHKKSMNIKLFPHHESYSFKDSIENKLQVFIAPFEKMVGHFQTHGSHYEIVLPFSKSLGGDYKSSIVYLSEKDSIPIYFQPHLVIGDSFSIKTHTYHFLSASEFGDTVKIVVSEKTARSIGFREGNLSNIPDSLYDIEGIMIKKASLKKYVLLDFWGTWCQPCIEGLPVLSSLANKFKDKLSVISIAYDNDALLVKKMIAKKNMNWIHLFEKKRANNDLSLIKKYRVDCYPTFLLLADTGEIIVRSCGTDGLEKVEVFLDKNWNEKIPALTSKHKSAAFQNGLNASTEIVTENLPVTERLFYELSWVLKSRICRTNTSLIFT